MEFLPKNIDKDNIMLNDIIYHPPRKVNNNTDCIDIIYKDLSTGEKHVKSIENPEVELYFVKENFRDYQYNKNFIDIDRCEKHTCQYKKLPWYIAKVAGDDYTRELSRLVEMGQYRDIQKIHTYPYVFGSDIGIETFYRVNWLLEYDNEALKPLTKLFMDIEVDTIDYVGFPRDGECPINAITIVDDESNIVHTFLFDNGNNPQIEDFVKTINSTLDEMHDMFDDSYGVLDYKVYMYDDESKMIVDSFKLINTLKRDICLAWNGFGFDIPYIIDRIKKLGMEPEDVMCHKDFKHRVCKFTPDTRNFKVAEKGDNLILSSYTKFLDQMKVYAATRKGQSELRSNALTFIAQTELEDSKLDYSDEANIKTLPYVNYKKFYIYNVKDTLLQMGIERKVNDCEGLYLRSYSNGSNLDKVFRQTVVLRARAYYEYLLQGYILGNNINMYIRDDASSFSGAIVGNPLLNDYNGIKLFGYKSMYVFDNVIDMDLNKVPVWSDSYSTLF